MVWKKGQSGNYAGRPRQYPDTPEGVDRREFYKEAGRLRKKESYERVMNYFNSQQLASREFTEYTLNKIAADEAKAREESTKAQDSDPNSTEPIVLEDPLIFQHRQMQNTSLPMGLRLSIANNLAPYCYARFAAAVSPRFIETPVEVPNFENIEQAEDFLAGLAQRFASAELGSQSALDLSTLVRNWISAKHADQEFELKRLNADATGAEQVIRIEGGLPALPGTNIIMPDQHPSTAIEPPHVLEPTSDQEPVEQVLQNVTPAE